MYTRITQSGGHRYLQLVEGYRNDSGKVRQRVVASLGRVDQLDESKLAPLIGGLQRAIGQSSITAAVQFESAKPYGDLWALDALWQELGLGKALRRALRSSRRGFDAERLLRVMVFNRLCDPESKLGVLRWLDRVALPGPALQATHDHLLRTMDALMDSADAVERAVAGQIKPLLDDQVSVVFYDLTTIRIHGQGEVEGDLRRYGRSKELNGSARQFVLGVVQSACGLPLMHTVHPGNIAETTTLLPMLETVRKRFPIRRIVVVADRGLLSLDNVEAITALGTAECLVQFILAVPARRYGELGESVLSLDASKGVAETRFGTHRLVVAFDPERAAEQSRKRRARIEELSTFGQNLADKLDGQDSGKKHRGRKASDPGAYARFYRAVHDAELSRFFKIDYTAPLFTFDTDEDAIGRAEGFDGKLVLMTDIDDLPADEVIARYKALADIERGFRVLKSDIEIAPVHHRLPERIRAHAMICFLALLLHRVLRSRLRQHDSPLSPQRALELLRQIQRHRVDIGDQRFDGLTRIAPDQRDLFEQLKLPRPAA
jgi:hypothetical protein